MLPGAAGDQRRDPRNRLVTYLKDLGWLLLAGLLIPVFMAAAVAGLVFIIGQHLYWWIRGNTTRTSRISRADAK
jgi:hypothetical protein